MKKNLLFQEGEKNNDLENNQSICISNTVKNVYNSYFHVFAFVRYITILQITDIVT